MNSPTRAFTPGAPLAEALPALLRAASVTELTIESITKPPSFRGGTVSAAVQDITGRARTEHKSRGFGFWEFALEHSLKADHETRGALLTGALTHSDVDLGARSALSLDEFAGNLASGLWDGLPARTMVNLCSSVATDSGTDGHLVLLDLGVPSNRSSSIDVAAQVVDVLGLSGALFSSGTSFHFVSDQVVSHAQMTRVLARAQLLSPLIDSRWVSHQLLDGESRLRISTDTERNTTPHQLIALK